MPNPKSACKVVPIADAHPGQMYKITAEKSQKNTDHLNTRAEVVKNPSPVAISCLATSRLIKY